MRLETKSTTACNLHGQRKLVFQAIFLLLWAVESTCAISLDKGDAKLSSWSASETVVLGAVMGLISIVLLGFFIFTCMDCMNSEVSTESHPASNSSGVKWGGADSYNRGAGGTGYVSEVVNPDDLRNAPLPYSMVPTQIPEAGEFRGYQSGGGMVGYSQGAGFTNNPSSTPSAPSGYGADSSPGAGSGGQVRGRNYNPVDQEDRPPAYSEAIHR